MDSVSAVQEGCSGVIKLLRKIERLRETRLRSLSRSDF
jgi:hypothetical protein